MCVCAGVTKFHTHTNITRTFLRVRHTADAVIILALPRGPLLQGVCVWSSSITFDTGIIYMMLIRISSLHRVVYMCNYSRLIDSVYVKLLKRLATCFYCTPGGSNVLQAGGHVQ